MSKVYVLQSDLQKAKAGEKFYYNEGSFTYSNKYNPNYLTLPEEVVENWSIFKLQTEQPVDTDTFQWTDELIINFIESLNEKQKEAFKVYPKSFLNTFKQSTPKEEAIKVVKFFRTGFLQTCHLYTSH